MSEYQSESTINPTNENQIENEYIVNQNKNNLNNINKDNNIIKDNNSIVDNEKPDFTRVYYKKCFDYLITLVLYPSSKLNDSRRDIINVNYAQLRTDKAFVIDITHINTGAKIDVIENSFYNKKIFYQVNHKVQTDYDDNINNVCSQGIHIFKSKDRAKYYNVYMDDLIIEKYTGHFTFYLNNGARFKEVNLIEGKLWFEYLTYDEYGVLNYKLNYENGKKNGKAYQYFENRFVKEYTYVNNVLNGSYIVYDYNTSVPIECYTYNMGDLDGPYTQLSRDGSFTIVGFYKNNELFGDYKIYDTNNNVIVHEYYDANGNVEVIFNQKNLVNEVNKVNEINKVNDPNSSQNINDSVQDDKPNVQQDDKPNVQQDDKPDVQQDESDNESSDSDKSNINTFSYWKVSPCLIS